MKAAVLVSQNSALEIYDIEVPKLDVGQVLVRVEYSGICGKQIDEITGRQGDDQYIPHLLGHEGGGEVVEIGPGVTKVKPGNRVVMHWVRGSGIDARPPRFNHQGQVLSAGWVTTFSDYTIASENRLTPMPQAARGDVLALLGCAVTTGLGIVFHNARLLPGQSIAVFGVGGVGLNVVQGADLVNAYPIVALDRSDAKLEFARKFGATHTVNVDMPRYFELYRLGKLRLDELITNRFKLTEINHAVETVRAGQVCGRCLIEMASQCSQI